MLNNNKRNIKGRKSFGSKAGEVVGKGTRRVGKGIETTGKGVQATGKGVKAAGKGVEVAGKGVQVAGKGMQVAGKGMQAGGKAIGAAGSALTQAGAALSGTGVGAIVGVPLAALGAGAKVAGTGMDAAGKGTEIAGKGTETAGKGVEAAGKTTQQAGNAIDKTGQGISNTGKNVTNVGNQITRVANSANSKKEDIKQGIKDGGNLAKNVASGNILSAAKNALNLLKNKQLKKQLKRKIIMIILKYVALLIIIVALASCLFGIFNAMKDTMINLLSKASSFVSSAWQWLTDDYWIKLDESLDYVVDANTGEVLGISGNVKDEDLLDEKGETRDTVIEISTMVDAYVKQLGSQGISLQQLRILGDIDYSNDNLLDDEDNKKILEKYIAEFIRADIITQQPHKRSGTELVNPNNQNWVDGGVYLYRTTKELQLNEDDFVNGSYKKEKEPVENENYKQMTYMEPEKMRDMVKEINNSGNTSSMFSGNKQKVEELRYSYSINQDNGNLMIVEIKTIETKKSSAPLGSGFLGINDLSRWLQNNLNETAEYQLEIVERDYRELISKYTMPYEFLINLCEITQNPEFVYHVALLARETKIILAVQDNTTVEVEATLTRNVEKKKYVNYSGPSVEGATVSDLDPNQEEETITTTTQTPELKMEYADTWSFYEEFEYTKDIEGKITKNDPDPIVKEFVPSGDILSYVPEHEEYSLDPSLASPSGEPGKIKVEEHYEGEFVTKTETTIQTVTTTTTYSDPILKNSVEKSKQFLGLLRNDTGECPYDCYKEDTWVRQDPLALQCAKKAEFERQGKDVKYRIPNMTKMESPLNNLLSGVEMLYATLQSNSSGYNEDDLLLSDDQKKESYNIQNQYIADGDYGSAYVVKMQGLVEHLHYLMTFPDEKTYTIKDLLLDNIFGDDDEEDENYIPEYTWNGTTSELIEMLGMYAHQDMQESGILASVTVAQALLESGWGKSQLSATYNNYFGIKKGSGWYGPTVTMPTKEVINGQTITIKAEFRVYDSPLESLKNHSSILSNSRYSGVKGETNYRKAITIIKNGGYATDPNYVNKICQIIEQYGLTRFD